MSSVDGLISGLGTTDLIRQLMQLERQPVVRLQSRKTTADKSITALQGLNTKFAALAELAKKFGTTAGTWTAGGATSSHPANVAVQVAPGTAASSHAFTVQSLVQTHSVEYTGTSDTIDSTTFSVKYLDADGAQSTFSVDPTTSLGDLANKINASATSPVTAVYDPATFKLTLTSKTAGDLGRFDGSALQRTQGTVKPLTYATTMTGQDAEITLGSGDFATTLKSSTNLIEIAAGITVSLKIADPLTTVTVSVTEASKPADDVQKLVDAANEILKEIKTLTAYDSASKKPGLMQGDGMLRGLANDVLRSVYEAVGGDTAGSAGLQLTRDGLLQFDKAKFDTAYAEDPARVAALFTHSDGTSGVAQRLTAVAEAATKFGIGPIAQAIDSRRNDIQRIDDNIESWDARLALKESRLRRQFAALESMLGSAQQQGNWLAGQIASLPQMSSD